MLNEVLILFQVSIQPCPEGAAGLARWRCTQQIVSDMYSWAGTSPDLSECRSLWLTSLDSRIEEGDSITSIANDLSQVSFTVVWGMNFEDN